MRYLPSEIPIQVKVLADRSNGNLLKTNICHGLFHYITALNEHPLRVAILSVMNFYIYLCMYRCGNLKWYFFVIQFIAVISKVGL